jgi:hypothetical protein
VYEYTDDALCTLRVNESYRRLFGPGYRIDTQVGMERRQSFSFADMQRIKAAFSQAARTKGVSDCTFRFTTEEGASSDIRMALRYWGLTGEAKIIFAQFFGLEPHKN